MKKICKWLLKAVVAGFAAFLCASCFCYFYYNLPAHQAVTSCATDYAWSANHISMRGTEGFAYTKTDENGYVNTFPIKKDTTDILLMGSSHTEGFNVNYNQNYAYLLNQKLYDAGTDLYAYNIGMSSHTFGVCLNNLEDAIVAFCPTKYVVIETYADDVSMQLMKQMLNDTYKPEATKNSGLVYQLQKLDFARLVYSQLKNLSNNQTSASSKKTLPEQYGTYLDQVIEKAGNIASSYDCTLIILYSPRLSVDYFGNVITPEASEQLTLLESACEKYGVVFINAQSSYEAMYNETKHLPQGFVNTAVGAGHINQYGHACIADILFDYITEEGR